MASASSSMEHVLENQTICDRYNLERLLAQTSNTQIWAVRGFDGLKYNAKLTTLDSRGQTRSCYKAELEVFYTLARGRMVCNRSLNVTTPNRFPNLFFFGRHLNKYDAIVTDRVFSDVYSLMNDTLWRSLTTTTEYSMFADDMFLAVRNFHSYGFVHRNIKLHNFGTNNTDFLNLLNFSSAKRYIEPVTGHHVALGTEQTFVGSLKYASINAHRMLTLSRRDDLISLGYSIIDIMKRGLPWDRVFGNYSFAEQVNLVKQVKENTSLVTLCQGLPGGILCYMQTVSSLCYYNKPDYIGLRSMIGQLVTTPGE